MAQATPFLKILLFVNSFCLTVLQHTGENHIPSTVQTSTQNDSTSSTVTSSTLQSIQSSIQSVSDNINGSETSPTTTSAMHVTDGPQITDKPINDNSNVTQSSTHQQFNSPSSPPTSTITPTERDQPSDHENSTGIKTDQTVPTSQVTDMTTKSFSSPVTFPKLDRSWMEFFQRVHHFDGLYEYDGGRYSFDFVVMYVHPLDVYTLVAKLFDQDGAIIEMNGTSIDGRHIIFKQCDTFSADFRFTALSGMVLDGMLVTSSGSTYYTGNVTRPLNSSFTWFHMNKGLGPLVTGDEASTRTAIIIVIPASLAFLAVIGTTAVLCWASKKGLFGRRHKSYLLFKDNPVSYESEAETIHI